jgi:hypothetical protein
VPDSCRCRVCDLPFTFPAGQFTWRCGGCGLVNKRKLTERERAKGPVCRTCEGHVMLPSIEIDAEGQPTMHWQGCEVACPDCPGGADAGRMGCRRPLPGSLPFYTKYLREGAESMSYVRFVWALYEKLMAEDRQRRMLALVKERIRRGKSRDGGGSGCAGGSQGRAGGNGQPGGKGQRASAALRIDPAREVERLGRDRPEGSDHHEGGGEAGGD